MKNLNQKGRLRAFILFWMFIAVCLTTAILMAGPSASVRNPAADSPAGSRLPQNETPIIVAPLPTCNTSPTPTCIAGTLAVSATFSSGATVNIGNMNPTPSGGSLGQAYAASPTPGINVNVPGGISINNMNPTPIGAPVGQTAQATIVVNAKLQSTPGYDLATGANQNTMLTPIANISNQFNAQNTPIFNLTPQINVNSYPQGSTTITSPILTSVSGPITGATAPATGLMGLGVFRSTAPTLTDGQSTGINTDSRGNLRTTLMGNSGTTTPQIAGSTTATMAATGWLEVNNVSYLWGTGGSTLDVLRAVDAQSNTATGKGAASVGNFNAGASTVVAAITGPQVQDASDLSGRKINVPYAPLGSYKTASGGVSTATTVQMIAASGALKNTLLGITLTNSSNSLTNGQLTCYVVSNGVTVYSADFGASTGIQTSPTLSCGYPIGCGNNAVSLTTSAAVTSIIWSLSYVQDN